MYLQPLIEDLQKLWEGVLTYDATANESFNLRVALFWIINDFPAYGNLAGYSTYGRYTCPCCGDQTVSTWLKNGKKVLLYGSSKVVA